MSSFADVSASPGRVPRAGENRRWIWASLRALAAAAAALSRVEMTERDRKRRRYAALLAAGV